METIIDAQYTTSAQISQIDSELKKSELFFLDTAKEMGMSPEALKKRGIHPVKDGIGFTFRNFEGNPVSYVPEYNKAKYQAWKQRNKTFDGQFDSPYHLAYQTIRRRNDIIEKDLLEDSKTFKPYTYGKYKIPSTKQSGFGVIPYVNNTAIEFFCNNVSDHIFVHTEGEKKAISLDKIQIQALSYSGASNIRLKDDNIIDKILKSNPKVQMMLLDPDAIEVEAKKGHINTARQFQFANSVIRFAEDVFDMNKKRGKKNIAYMVICKNQKIDDLINTPDSNKNDIRVKLHEFKENEYFIFLKLTQKTLKKDVYKFFGISNPNEFFDSYPEAFKHIDNFRFKGLDIKINNEDIRGDNLFNSIRSKYLTLENDKFNIDLPKSDDIYINKYLSEKKTDILSKINQNFKIGIHSPTNSGKTRFFVDLAKDGQKLVIFLDNKMLVEAFVSDYGGSGLYENKTQYSKNETLIFATWDKAKYIHDIADRWAICDESHSIVQQYGDGQIEFRAETIRNFLDVIENAQKQIFLSGTPNLGFYYSHNVLYVKCIQSVKKVISTYIVEAEAKSNKAYLKAILSILNAKDNIDDNSINVILWDNTEMLIQAKQILIDQGFKSDDIAIISRKTIDEGETQTYRDVVRKNTFGKKQIILTTRIASQGINIYDDNKVRVICIGNDQEKAIQMSNRWRGGQNIELVCILAPDTGIKPQYTLNTKDVIDAKIESAKYQLILAQSEIDSILEEFDHYSNENDPQLLEFKKQIFEDSNSGKYFSKTCPDIYIDKNGSPKIDILKILASEKKRQLDYQPNIAFITDLIKHDNISFKGKYQIETNNEIDPKLIDKSEIKDQSIKHLYSNPELMIQCLKQHYIDSGNKYGLSDIDFYCPNVEVSSEAMRFYESNKSFFHFKQYTKPVRQLIKLLWIGYDTDSALKLIEKKTAKDFDLLFDRFFHIQRLTQFKNKYHKLKMSALSRLDAKLEAEAISLAMRIWDKSNGCFDLKTYRDQFNKLLQKSNVSKLDAEKYLNISKDDKQKLKVQKYVDAWSEDRILKLLQIHFDTQTIKYTRSTFIQFIGIANNPFESKTNGNCLKQFARYFEHLSR
jgi:hypothetical protein